MTLFGPRRLAIGIVVDDAIVVDEACRTSYRKKGLTPRDAAIRCAMEEVSGARGRRQSRFLTAVFCSGAAFISGIVGQFFRQICGSRRSPISTLISAFNSLTLSPRPGGPLLLKPKTPHGHGERHSAAECW